MEQNLNENQKNNAKKINIEKYEKITVGEIPLKKLSLGLWWLKNRLKLKNLLIILLIVISTISWGYYLYHMGYYLFFGMKEDEMMIRELVSSNVPNEEILNKTRAVDMFVSQVGILAVNGKYDLYVNLQNPNQKHWGIFNYCFEESEKKIECGNGFIFPNENKYIISLAKEFSRQPSGVKFSLNNVRWKTINRHEIPSWSNFKKDRLDIEIKNAIFTPSAEISEKVILNILSFTAINNTAFGYWEAPLIITIWQGNKIAGINTHIIKDFFSNEEREIKIIWPGYFSGINAVKIFPNINIMAKEVYLAP